MKPMDSIFFSKGGFSSSQWSHTQKINDVSGEDSFYQKNLILGDLVTNQRKANQKENTKNLSVVSQHE